MWSQCGLLSPQPAQPHQPTPGDRLALTAKDADDSLNSDWFGIYFQGKKIGYFNSSRKKIEEPARPFYRDKILMTMKLQSFGQKSEMKFERDARLRRQSRRSA